MFDFPNLDAADMGDPNRANTAACLALILIALLLTTLGTLSLQGDRDLSSAAAPAMIDAASTSASAVDGG
ncbi:MAG TPA: hypothetical protein VFB45_21145 [Pseudolabrys sp.]|nr:hypothetical protein [Pseudolabrys sp.]